jgi:hypothetical protein
MKKQTSSRLLYQLFPTTYLSLLLLALLFPAGLCLPAWWGWENGPLENLQVFVLIAGLAISWLAAWNSEADRQARNLWRWLTPFWLLGILRELSWGRVFYPVSMGAHGPEFIPLQQLPYGFLVKPLVAIMIVVTLIAIYRTDPVTYILQTKLPVPDVVTLFLAMLIAVLGDRNLFSALQPYHQILEEWAELTAYWSMVSIAAITGFTKPARFSIKPVKKRAEIRRL